MAARAVKIAESMDLAQRDTDVTMKDRIFDLVLNLNSLNDQKD